jgi:hypothetical protein
VPSSQSMIQIVSQRAHDCRSYVHPDVRAHLIITAVFEVLTIVGILLLKSLAQ